MCTEFLSENLEAGDQMYVVA